MLLAPRYAVSCTLLMPECTCGVVEWFERMHAHGVTRQANRMQITGSIFPRHYFV